MTTTKALIILQARRASRRLPDKALAPIGDRPILAWCLDRLLLSGVGAVVLATTTNREDDELATMAWGRGVPVVRGPEHDVLRRFVMAAGFGATHVVRATADNPAVDIDGPGRVLEALRATKADYVIEQGLPYGAGVEGFTVEALLRADGLADAAADREHVTPIMRRDGMFSAIEVMAPAALCHPELRLTIDSLEDLEYMRRVMASLAGSVKEPPLAAVIGAALAVASAKTVRADRHAAVHRIVAA